MKKLIPIVILIIIISTSLNLFGQAEEFSKKAYNYNKNKDYPNAVIYAKKAIVLSNQNLSYLNSLCWYQLLNKDFNDALQTVKNANDILKNNPSNSSKPYILMNLGHAYLLSGNFDKGIDIYHQNKDLKVNGLSWYKAITDDLIILYKLNSKNKNLTKAILDIIKYRDYASVSETLMTLEMYQECVDYYTEKINDSTSIRPYSRKIVLSHYFSYRADAKVKLKDFNDAILDYKYAIQKEDGEWKQFLYSKIASTYIKSSSPEKSISIFNKNIVPNADIDLEEAKSIFMNGRFSNYFELEDNIKKLDKLNLLLKNEPENFILLSDRAFVYYMNNEYQKALTDINKSISYNSKTYVWSYVFRGKIKEQLKNNTFTDDYNLALQICNNALAINKSPENYLTRAIIYTYLEQYDNAISDCNNRNNTYQNEKITLYIKSDIYSLMKDEENYEKINLLSKNAKNETNILGVEYLLIQNIESKRLKTEFKRLKTENKRLTELLRQLQGKIKQLESINKQNSEISKKMEQNR